MSKQQKLRKKLLQFNDPALHVRCERIEPGHPVRALEQEMRDVLKAFENGVGLAAPQIGHLVRAVLIRDRFLINPELVWTSVQLQTVKEGCLSYPGHYCEVTRHVKVILKHQYGEVQFEDYDAAIAEHELDHLDGVCKVGDDWRANSPELEV